MIRQQSYNKTLDYYSLGIVLYELLFGVPPFYSADFSFEDLKSKILYKEIAFPKSDVSNPAMDLIVRLTKKDVRERLGLAQGFQEIIAHPWLESVNIEDIKYKRVRAPLAPALHEINFDLEFVKQDVRALSDVCSEEPSAKPVGLYDRFSNFSFSIESKEQRVSTRSTMHQKETIEDFELVSVPGKTQSENLPDQRSAKKAKLRIFNEEFRKDLEFLNKKNWKAAQKQIFEEPCEDIKAERTPKIQKIPASREKHVGDVMKQEELPFIDDLSSIRSSNMREGLPNKIFLRKDEDDANELSDREELKTISKELNEKPKDEMDSSYHTAFEENEGEVNSLRQWKYLKFK